MGWLGENEAFVYKPAPVSGEMLSYGEYKFYEMSYSYYNSFCLRVLYLLTDLF